MAKKRTKTRTRARARPVAVRVQEPAPEPAGPEPAPEVAAEVRTRRLDFLRRFSALEVALVAACVAFVVWHLRPGLLFANTTPAAGDTGGHVWGPQFLRAHLFDRGLLAGWSNDWFGGFPAYRFYMPIPALGAVLLGTFLPYGIALKVMLALPLVALPIVAWRFGRAARLSTPGPALLAIASLLFLFDSSNLKFGGSIASSIAGEYGNALAITLALLCFAIFVEDLERGRRGPMAGVVGAIAACCHPVGFGFVIVGLLAMVGASAIVDLDQALRELPHLGRTLALTLTISAFWYVPFFAFHLYTNDLNFARVTGVRHLLFPLPIAIELVLAVLFVIGLLDAIANARRAVLGLALTGGLFALAALVAPRGMLWNARLAPPWYLMWVLVAAAGANVVFEWACERVGDRRRRWFAIAAPIACAAIVLGGLAWDMGTLPGTTKTQTVVDGRKFTTQVHWLVGPSHTPSVVPAFVAQAFGGYQRDVHWAEYDTLISTMKRLTKQYGCGRLMPEFDPTGRYGSVYGADLLPYWTDSCVATITGLYNDSSATAPVALVAESALSQTYSAYQVGLPYEPLSLAKGVHYLRELGARYYLAVSKAAIAQARATKGLPRRGHGRGIGGVPRRRCRAPATARRGAARDPRGGIRREEMEGRGAELVRLRQREPRPVRRVGARFLATRHRSTDATRAAQGAVRAGDERQGHRHLDSLPREPNGHARTRPRARTSRGGTSRARTVRTVRRRTG